jgi:hypothetical protein
MGDLKLHRFALSIIGAAKSIPIILGTAVEVHIQVYGIELNGCSTARHFTGNDKYINGVTWLRNFAIDCSFLTTSTSLLRTMEPPGIARL